MLLYDAVFALEKPGDISGLIPTDSGYYIVKYVSDAKVTDSDLSDYRKTVRQELLTSRQSEKTNAILEEWRSAVNYEYDYEKAEHHQGRKNIVRCFRFFC